MKSQIITYVIIGLMLVGCNSKPSLEKYFVENTENKNFVQVDVSPSILNIEKNKLSISEQSALKSFNKMNVLAFKLNDKNQTQFETERTKVSEILKDEKYQQLMKFGSGKEGAQVSYVGNDEHISEFVVFGNSKESGFAIVRVLGKDMNPTSIMTMLSVLKSSKIDLEQLKPLKDLMN
jgi:uncharacterized protein YcfL